MGLVSYGVGGLVVAHVGRRLLFGRLPRQCAMPRHNGNFLSSLSQPGYVGTNRPTEHLSILKIEKHIQKKFCSHTNERTQTQHTHTCQHTHTHTHTHTRVLGLGLPCLHSSVGKPRGFRSAGDGPRCKCHHVPLRRMEQEHMTC